MTKKTLLIVGLAAAAGATYWFFFRKPKTEKKSNASGSAIGASPCGSPNDNACSDACEKLGGSFNSDDRRCYKGGVAIPFGGMRVLTSRKIITTN
jgi:chitodextrinase